MDRAMNEQGQPPGDAAALEEEILRREERLASAQRDLKARMRSGVTPIAIEPHRNWHIFALGADLSDCGLRGSDAFALMGLRSLPLQRVIDMLQVAEKSAPGSYLARLLPGIIDEHRDELHARGLVVSHRRRWLAYQGDLASWRAQPDDIKRGPWRSWPMTSGQRELVRVTATLLEITFPEGLMRGTAADWLSAHSANLNYRKGL